MGFTRVPGTQEVNLCDEGDVKVPRIDESLHTIVSGEYAFVFPLRILSQNAPEHFPRRSLESSLLGNVGSDNRFLLC